MSEMNRIYAEYAGQYLTAFQTRRISEAPLSVHMYKDAIVLPLKKNEQFPAQKHAYLGGVCDFDFRFLAGSAVKQERFSCPAPYRVAKEAIKTSDETVIFGGVIYGHFGVMLLLSLTRFWWIVGHADVPYKIVFLQEPGSPQIVRKNCERIMEVFGIAKERYLILSEPTSFSGLIVPDEALSCTDDRINVRFWEPFYALKAQILEEDGPLADQKLYFSRSRYTKGRSSCDGLNEEYYEAFFERRGYRIVHPQEYSLREQIRFIASANEIVSTYGTMAHLITLFAGSGTRQVMLLRAKTVDPWFSFEATLLLHAGLDWYIVEAAQNPYPTLHDTGAFLYYPTEYFRSYLEDAGIPFAEAELHAEITNAQFRQYILRWLECYANPAGFRRLKNPGLFPVMQALAYQMTGVKPDAKEYLDETEVSVCRQ